MKPPPTIALIAAGQLRDAFWTRMPALLDRLGPVKGFSYRVASRISNTIRAGTAVEGYEALDRTSLIWIAVPDAVLPHAIAELAGAPLKWTNKIVAVADSRLDLAVLEPLKALGSRCIMVNAVEGFDGQWLLVEGERSAGRALRRLTPPGGKIIQLHASRKALYFAGINCGTTVLMAAISASVECLRQSGMQTGQAASLASRLVDRTLRSYLKGGRKAWSPGGVSASELGRQADAVARWAPRLASYYPAAAAQSVAVLKKQKELSDA